MKTLFLALALVTVQFSAQAQYKKATLQAAGLTCAMCSNATYKALKTLPFIDRIDTDLNNTTFVLYFKPNSTVNPDQISNKVEGAGFSVARLTITVDFDKLKVENDAQVDFGGQTLHFISVKPQVLQGEKDITLIDKQFVSAKAFKKYSTQTKMHCYETGTAAGKRIYHVTI